ncbi:MAG: hypothetical protein H3C47_08830 [Candidatus Cloacimonetes bacterium]|nr:hypothetical protein [Candidatus Cloacimonadota bacterium]
MQSKPVKENKPQWDEEIEDHFPRLPKELRNKVLKYIEDYFESKNSSKN